MSNTITTRDLTMMGRRIDADLERLGMLPEGQHTAIENGSKTNGISFKIVMVDAEHRARHRHPAFARSGGHIGMTRREAFDTLAAISDALDAVAAHQTSARKGGAE